MANLSTLIKGAPALQIETIMENSQHKCVNGMFFCLPGLVYDGHDFIDEAIENGAVCIVYVKPLLKMKADIVYIQVEDAFKALKQVANIFFDFPSQKLKTIGVTGTNGKSTVAYLIKAILDNYEISGYIGTIAIEYENIKIEPNYSTPTTVELLGYLKAMADHGCKTVTIEATSQGLAQGRLDTINFSSAIFTNLTYDHLDYHRNMENYFLAKQKLFQLLDPHGLAIINADDEYGQRLLKTIKTEFVTYGIENTATYQASDLNLSFNQTNFTLKCFNQQYQVSSQLVSRFNVYNLLAAIAYTHQAGYDLQEIITFIKEIKQIDGRMQRIKEPLNFSVIIDYAHTPDGYQKFFEFVRAATPKNKRIITIFGAPGKRDKEKRAMLGQIASEYSDLIVLTEEDPRDENPVEIAKEIQASIVDCKSIIVIDRYDAIYQAMMLANEEDTVCILGKGFERFIDRKDGRETWLGDDQAVQEIINEHFLNPTE